MRDRVIMLCQSKQHDKSLSKKNSTYSKISNRTNFKKHKRFYKLDFATSNIN